MQYITYYIKGIISFAKKEKKRFHYLKSSLVPMKKSFLLFFLLSLVGFLQSKAEIVVLNPNMTESQAVPTDAVVDNYMYQGVNYKLDFKSNSFVVKKLADDVPYSGNIVVPDSIVFENTKVPVTGLDGPVFSDTPDLKSLTINANIEYFNRFYQSGLESLTLNSDSSLRLDYITGGLENLKKVEINCDFLYLGASGDVGVWFEGVDSIVFNCRDIFSSGFRANGAIDFGDAWVYLAWTGLVYNGEKLTLPGKIYLGDAALYRSDMSEVELPVLVRNPKIDETQHPYYIGNYCFSDCPNLKKLVVHDPTPWPASPEAFLEFKGFGTVSTDSTLYTQCTLFVPGVAVDTYKADPVWGKFKNIVPLETGVIDIKSDYPEDNDKSIEYFTIDGQRLTTPEPGTLIIRRQGSRTDKIIVK